MSELRTQLLHESRMGTVYAMPVGLAAALALDGRQTLVIDLDPQGNATSGLGARDTGPRASIYDLLMGETPFDEAVIALKPEHLHLVPAHRDLVGAELELVSAIGREFRLKDALKPVIYEAIVK